MNVIKRKSFNYISNCGVVARMLLFSMLITEMPAVYGSSMAISTDTQPIFKHCLAARANLIFVVERSRTVPARIYHVLKDVMRMLMKPFIIGRGIRVYVKTFEFNIIRRRSPRYIRMLESDIMGILNRLPAGVSQNLAEAVKQIDKVVAGIGPHYPGRRNIVVYLWSDLNLQDAAAVRKVLNETAGGVKRTVFILGFVPMKNQNDSRSSANHVFEVNDNVFIVHTLPQLTAAASRVVNTLCPACDPRWKYYKGSCYMFKWPNYQGREANLQGWSGIKWFSAKTGCEKSRSHLVSINSPAESAFLVKAIIKPFQDISPYLNMKKFNSRFLAIGLTRVGEKMLKTYQGMFHWVDNKPLTFVKWDRIGLCSPRAQPDGGKIEGCMSWKIRNDSVCGWHDIGCGDPMNIAFICEKPARNITLIKRIPRLPRVNISSVPASKLSTTFQCRNGEYIISSLQCDGIKHCRDGSDEQACGSVCDQTQFQCANGRCISLNFYCDFKDDCQDNSDEIDCVAQSCDDDKFQCKNNQCIEMTKRCDLVQNCGDHSDELDCDSCKGFWCHDGKCIPKEWTCDGLSDCPIKPRALKGEDEVKRLACPGKLSRPVNPEWKNGYRCHLVPDGFGRFHGPRHMFHLRHCGRYPCHEGFFRCPGSYCIAPSLVCNGVTDCIGGEDEMYCAYFLCPNYLRCSANGVCIRLKDICDGFKHCPNGYDELHCNQEASCPEGCSCKGRIVQCSGSVYHASWNNIHSDTRSIDMSNVSFRMLQEYNISMFWDMFWLGHLNLSASNITTIPPNLILPNLYSLDLSFNDITEVKSNAFKILGNLRFLNMTTNLKLHFIRKNGFSGLDKLQFLDLSHTDLVSLELNVFQLLTVLQFLNISNCNLNVVQKDSFIGLSSLKSLDMTGNVIKTFYNNLFRGLDKIKTVFFSTKTLCCSAFWGGKYLHSSECIAPEESISSCEDLLQKNAFRIFLWIFGIMAIIGNAIVVVYRLFFDSSSIGRSYGVFVTNLAISDFVMGVYMLIICIADVSYRGTYLIHEREWLGSHFCKMAGFLSTISCIGSGVFICLITLDRFVVIRFPFKKTPFTPKVAAVVSAVVWGILVGIVMVPLIPPMNQWELFQQNGVCLALPLSVDRHPGWLYSTSLFIGFNFVVFFFIAIGQLAIYRAMVNMSMVQDKKRTTQEIKVAKKLSMIVLSNFLCWFPICVMGLATLNNLKIDAEIYAWVAVFVLPVNSAINPFLYTIPTLLNKKPAKEHSTSSINLSSNLTIFVLDVCRTSTGKLKYNKYQLQHFMTVAGAAASNVVDDHIVYLGEPKPGMKRMRDLINLGMLSPNHVQWVCGNIMSALPSLNIHPTSKPIKLFVKMKGNVPSEICLSFDDKGKEFCENAIEHGLVQLLNKQTPL